MENRPPLRVGIGGPVGSGKTALVDALCKSMRDDWRIAVVTNDIYTKEDQQFLIRSQALPAERIVGVETGGCTHTAIREDASINLAAVDDLSARFPDLDLIFVESGGDNLSATFSPELADLMIYVIDVAAGDKIPRKGGPGITRSDLLVINKIDLAPHVGASLEVMDRDARRMRGSGRSCFPTSRPVKGSRPSESSWRTRECSNNPAGSIAREDQLKKPHEMPSLSSKIPFGLGAAVLAACGTAVTVNPGFSSRAAGNIDRMLLVIDNQGGLRGLVGGERPVEAITAEVQEALSGAGYPIRTPAELGLSETEITALSAGRAPPAAPADYSHVLEVTLAPVQHGKAPSGFSLTLGDSDPRGQGSPRGEVLPISCALLDGRSLREEAIARSDRAVPKGEEGWRSKASGPDQRVAALAAEIRATCEPLLGELNVARTGGEPAATTYGSGIRIEVVPAEEVAKEKAAVSTAPAPAPAPEPASPIDTAAPKPAPSPVGQGREQAAAPPAPGQPGPASEPVAAEPPAVSTEHTTTKTGRKQIRVYNPGGTVILEFGHERR